MLPPYNTTTTDVKDVYALSGIVSDEEWKQLMAPAKALLKLIKQDGQIEQARKDKKVTGFVAHRLGQLKGLDKAEKRRVVGCLLYFQHLLFFKKLPRGRPDMKLKDHEDMPEVIKNKMLKAYTQRQGGKKRAVTDVLGNKLINTLLILAVIAAGFSQGTDSYTLDQTDLSLLLEDVGLMGTVMLNYFREAGCKVSGSIKQGSAQVVLTAPLKLPSFRKIRAKSKR